MQEWLKTSAERGVPLLYFSDQTHCHCHESPAQLWFIERAHQRICERTGDGWGKLINSAPVGRALSQSDACKGKRLIAGLTDPVCSLPGGVALNARTGVEDVMPAQPNHVAGIWRW